MISSNVKLRAEFKPLLSCLSLYVEFPRELLQKVLRVTVEPHQIVVEENKCNRFVFELEGLTLLPSTCRSLRWASPTELQLTLHANQIGDNGQSNEPSSTLPPSNQDFLVSRIQSSHHDCICVGCGARIFKSQSHFKRVLPLPSENWSDFADIWFCHNHSHDVSQSTDSVSSVSCSGDGPVNQHVKELKKFPMLPRVDDCLVSSLFMLADSSHVRSGCVAQSAGRLMCKRCGNFIGFVKDEKNGANEQSSKVYKIYHHAVSFSNKENCEPESYDSSKNQEPTVFDSEKQQHVEDFMCCLLRDQSHLFTSFRFIITSSLQASGQSSISILLWLLDQDLCVYSANAAASNQTKAERRIRTAPKKYIKLLYKATFTTLGENRQSASSLTKASNVFEAWRLDNTVHGISLPYPLCKQLVHMLVTSTNTLNASLRNLNGFHVGFLKSS